MTSDMKCMAQTTYVQGGCLVVLFKKFGSRNQIDFKFGKSVEFGCNLVAQWHSLNTNKRACHPTFWFQDATKSLDNKSLEYILLLFAHKEHQMESK